MEFDGIEKNESTAEILDAEVPVTENTAEVVAENTAEVVAEDTAEVVAENTAEVVAENTAEVVAEDTAEDVEKATFEDVTEDITELVEGDVTEPSIGEAAENVCEIAANAVGVGAKSTGFVLKKIHIFIAGVCAVVLVVGCVFFGMWLGDHLKERSGIDPNAEPYSSGSSSATLGEAEIAIPGYKTVYLPANSKKVGIILPNPEGNPCYFRFCLILSETGEVLYESKLIPPGMALKEITLSRPLSVGEYALDILIETESLSDRTPMNGANLQVTLVVR